MKRLENIINNIEQCDVFLRYNYATLKGDFNKDPKYLEELEDLIIYFDISPDGKGLDNNTICIEFENNFEEFELLMKKFGFKFKTLYNEFFGSDYWGVSYIKDVKECENNNFKELMCLASNYNMETYEKYGISNYLITNPYVQL